MKVRLVGLSLALAFMLSGQAVAQVAEQPKVDWTKIDSYSPNQTPIVQTPTNKIKNIIGRSVETACLRNGRAKVACSGAAAAAGGVGVARLMDTSWSDIKTVAGDTVVSAGVSALAGCAAGAAIGVWAAGAGAIPGCLGGALQGAIYGGFFGAVGSATSLTKDGSVQLVNGAANASSLTGDGVRKTSGSSAAARGSVGTYSTSSNNVNYGTIVVDPVVLSGIPINSTFVVSQGSNYYRALRVSAHVLNSNSTTFRIMNSNVIGQGGSGAPQGAKYNPVQSTAYDRYTAGGPFQQVNVNGPTSSCSAPAGDLCPMSNTVPANGSSATLYFIDKTVAYTTAAAVPMVQYSQIDSVYPWAMGFSNALHPSQLNQDVSDSAIAALANAALKAAGTSAGGGLYDPSQPVTAADVATVVATDPQSQVQVQDLLRPVADLNSAGGTLDNPLPEPAPVRVVNPGTQVGSQTGTSQDNPTHTQEAAKNDLEAENAGLLGNPLQPLIDFIAGPFSIYTNPIISGPGSQPCPVWNIEYMSYFTSLFTASGNDAAVDEVIASVDSVSTAPVCNWLEEWKGVIQAVIGFGLVFLAFVWYFE